MLALAGLLEDRGDGPQARARYEQALALESAKPDKEQTLRTLMALALDEKDWAAAKGFHRALMALEPTSLFVRGELARALNARGEYGDGGKKEDRAFEHGLDLECRSTRSPAGRG